MTTAKGSRFTGGRQATPAVRLSPAVPAGHEECRPPGPEWHSQGLPQLGLSTGVHGQQEIAEASEWTHVKESSFRGQHRKGRAGSYFRNSSEKHESLHKASVQVLVSLGGQTPHTFHLWNLGMAWQPRGHPHEGNGKSPAVLLVLLVETRPRPRAGLVDAARLSSSPTASFIPAEQNICLRN